MKVEFILMGCSVSSGVPAIGNDWGVCDPAEPKNRRNRACAVVRSAKTTLVIDTGPDFRTQMNDLQISEIDAVLYSHAHSDHIQGIDELRIVKLRTKKLVNIYGSQETMAELRRRFDYLFHDHPEIRIYPQVLDPHVIEPSAFNKPMTLGDITFTPFNQDHGDMDCLGFRFGNMAYSPDMLDIDDAAVETLRGVDVWIADGAGFHMEDHKTHAPLSRIYALNERIKARKVYICGLSKFMDYKALKDELPPNFEPAWDGLRIEFNI